MREEEFDFLIAVTGLEESVAVHIVCCGLVNKKQVLNLIILD